MVTIQWPRIAACLLLAMAPASALHAQRESSSVPVHIADPLILIGKYRFDEDGGKVEVTFNADRTATYVIEAEGETMRADGLWTLDGPFIHIHSRPAPVRLDPVGTPIRDPKVAWSIAATLPNGTPAEGLGVTWDEAHGLYGLDEGKYIAAIGEERIAGPVEIIRMADRRTLQTIEVKPGGPNSFRFTYHPSPEEPFDIPAFALDRHARTIEVEEGTGHAQLRRVGALAAPRRGGARRTR